MATFTATGLNAMLGTSFTASGVATTASVASAGLAAASFISQGNAVKAESKFQSKIAGIEAEGREVERRRRLIQALNVQTAGQAARGIQPGGTPKVILQDALIQSDLDKATISSNLATRRELLSTQGKNAQVAGRISAATTILGSIQDYSRRGSVGPVKQKKTWKSGTPRKLPR